MSNPFAHPKQPDVGSSFLPEDYVSRKADGRANLLCLFLFGVVMAGVGSAFVVTNRQWKSVEEEQNAINTAYEQESKKIEQLKELELQRESMIERAEITTALVEKNPRSVLAAELVQRMPEGVTLLTADLKSKRVTVAPALESREAGVKSLSGSSSKSTKSSKSSKSSKSKSDKSEAPPAPKLQAPRFETALVLTGVAGENQQIADYLQALKQCDVLEAVELAYIKETVMSDMTLRKFEIGAKLRDAPKTLVRTPTSTAPAPSPDAEAASDADTTAALPAADQTESGESPESTATSATAGVQPGKED